MYSPPSDPRKPRSRDSGMATGQFNVQRQAFWLSYRPADGDILEDFPRVLETVFATKVALVGSDDIRQAVEYWDCVLFSRERVAVGKLYNQRRWARAGARGSLSAVDYSKDRESVRSFLTRWVEAIRRNARVFGSEESLWMYMRRSTDEASRQRDSRRRRQRERLKAVASSPTTTATVLDTPLVGSSNSSAENTLFNPDQELQLSTAAGQLSWDRLVSGSTLALQPFSVGSCPVEMDISSLLDVSVVGDLPVLPSSETESLGFDPLSSRGRLSFIPHMENIVGCLILLGLINCSASSNYINLDCDSVAGVDTLSSCWDWNGMEEFINWSSDSHT